MEKVNLLKVLADNLNQLKNKDNYRSLPVICHAGQIIQKDGNEMLNLSSNDYLGLATDNVLRQKFLDKINPNMGLFSASSSRLMAGNYTAHTVLETQLSELFGTESALIFNSGYHMNIGILPASCTSNTLILADKLVHASLIDGIRLSKAKYMRYRHADYEQLESLIKTYATAFDHIIIVTESIFSMDGDVTDLNRLVKLKKKYDHLLLYVDEAHAVGVRGNRGLGCAEEQDCIADIDFLTGTFGKALASVGGYVVCNTVIKDYLINKMRSFIYTTALPPINLMWTQFILSQLNDFKDRRQHLNSMSALLRQLLCNKGYDCPSQSHIIPLIIGDSQKTVLQAEAMAQKGFYVLPVRPPTVALGKSRIRISLTANITKDIIYKIADYL